MVVTRWNATLEYPVTISDDRALELVERGTSGDAPVVGVHGDRGRTSVSFGVEAGTLRQATEAATHRAGRLVAGIIGAAPVSLRVLTLEALAADLMRPSMPDLVDSAGARELLGGISQQRLSQLRDKDGFPRPIQQSGTGGGIWVKAAVEAYAKLERRPGRPRKRPAP